MATEQRTCKQCGGAFLFHPGGRRIGDFCSLHCSNASRRVAVESRPLRTCPTCGEPFRVIRPAQRFCSRTCFFRSGISANNGCVGAAKVSAAWEHRPRTSVTRECRVCGRGFTVYPSELPKRAAVYCGAKCAGNARERLFHTCEWCGDSYEVIPSRLGHTRFCSHRCLVLSLAEKNTKLATEAKSRCASKHWLVRRREVLERDNFTCRKCGRTSDLTVHHLVSWRKTQDDSPENLLTLCRGCHYRTHFPDGVGPNKRYKAIY